MAHRFVIWRERYVHTFEEIVKAHSSLTDEEKECILFYVSQFMCVFDFANMQLYRFGDTKYQFIFQKTTQQGKTIRVTIL